uniref:Uncharacterized protein n=1 Tax=Arundo donax TaxID=35708 RepID=A0A0A8ZE31_ARUDO
MQSFSSLWHLASIGSCGTAGVICPTKDGLHLRPGAVSSMSRSVLQPLFRCPQRPWPATLPKFSCTGLKSTLFEQRWRLATKPSDV